MATPLTLANEALSLDITTRTANPPVVGAAHRTSPRIARLATLLFLPTLTACGARTGLPVPDGRDASVARPSPGGADAGSDSPGGPLSCVSAVPLRTQSVDKVDLLFMIDNSTSMGDKQALLAQAVPDMIARLVTPNCIDDAGHVVGVSSGGGVCASGQLEFAPVHDMHVGIVTSSLGSRGGDVCPSSAVNETNPALNAHNDDGGELINRGGDAETPIPRAGSLNFLAWFPPVAANQGKTTQVPPETVVGVVGQPSTLIGDFTSMISGVHEHGCGFEAQNEAWYRFLVQPDPFDQIAVSNNVASLDGIDAVILQQRKAFLRPDSLVVVIVVTDENEEVANPMSVGGAGWQFESAPFPGSPTFGAPEGTIECRAPPGPMSGPNDPNCTSCAFGDIVNAPNFAARCPNDPPNGTQGFVDPSNDNIDVRFFEQKRRFGVFAGYPVSRYVRGLTRLTVPDRAHEVASTGNYVGDGDTNANCTNPLFAQDLPTDPRADLCHLKRGPRTPDLVYYAAIAGVPHQLVQARAGIDPECAAGTAQVDCPQKERLTEADWLAITGKDPEHYDFTGADFHMLESEEPRAASACPPSAGDHCDPVNGREWTTDNRQLQFACIFPLGAPKDCTSPAYAGACDCAQGSDTQNTPLCQESGGVHTTIQTYAKAYPSVREMLIAHAMANQPTGVQGIVSSLCPIHTAPSGPVDDVLGYRPAMRLIVNRLKDALRVQCLPTPACLGASGARQCVVWVTLPQPGGEDACNRVPGLSIPAVGLLQPYRQSQHDQWVAVGGASSGLPDPDRLPICTLQELTMQMNPGAFGADGTCATSADPGWCIAPGSGSTCPQQIAFSAGQPPTGAMVSLQCAQ